MPGADRRAYGVSCGKFSSVYVIKLLIIVVETIDLNSLDETHLNSCFIAEQPHNFFDQSQNEYINSGVVYKIHVSKLSKGNNSNLEQSLDPVNQLLLAGKLTRSNPDAIMYILRVTDALKRMPGL